MTTRQFPRYAAAHRAEAFRLLDEAADARLGAVRYSREGREYGRLMREACVSDHRLTLRLARTSATTSTAAGFRLP